MEGIKDKVVVITGASSELRKFSRAGAVTHRRGEQSLGTLSGQRNRQGHVKARKTGTRRGFARGYRSSSARADWIDETLSLVGFAGLRKHCE
jgi:hypothetical protein